MSGLPDDGTEFDVVIVGAGSAGCVLAYRLSEDPRRQILLIEAGPPDRYPFIHMPKGIGKVVDRPGLIWSYEARPYAGANQSERWLRGRTLGGSSSVNGMMYVRGQAEDYDDWEALGNPGWGARDMLAAFAAMETRESVSGSSGTGPLRVSAFPRREPACEALIAAGVENGLTRRDDIDAPVREGIGYLMRTIASGRRNSAARAFLNKAKKRPNLRVVTDALVERVELQGKRATGVVCRVGGETRLFRAREVILSAGAIESPKLLMLSGIGPQAPLKSFGIPVVQDLPGVGQNLREHRLLTFQFRLKPGRGYNRQLRGFGLWKTAAQYMLFRRGLLADGIYDVAAFFRTEPGGKRPDAQLLAAPFTFDLTTGRRYDIERQPGLQSIGYPLRPESQGSVSLQSLAPGDSPAIVTNYLDSDYDRRVSIGLFRFARALFNAPALGAYVDHEITPGLSVQSDDEIIGAFREKGGAGFHASGTCKMGVDPLAVVDPDLRVHGIDGLRVIDASIMPTLVSGNTNGPTMAIAWRAAGRILDELRASERQ